MNNHTNKHPHLKLVTSTLVIAASQAGAQDLIHKAPPQDMPIAISGATIHPMSGPSIGTGYHLWCCAVAGGCEQPPLHLRPPKRKARQPGRFKPQYPPEGR